MRFSRDAAHKEFNPYLTSGIVHLHKLGGLFQNFRLFMVCIIAFLIKKIILENSADMPGIRPVTVESVYPCSTNGRLYAVMG